MTYSIVARDPGTGELGVAVQSHWFGVGPIVPWARPGVGAVATQANAEVAYGPRALDLLERGMSARGSAQATARRGPAGRIAPGRRSSTPAARWRRTPAMPAWPSPVTSRATASPARPTSWPPPRSGRPCSTAYAGSRGSLTTRLLAALNVAEATGGDLRGRQSAAILVVPAAGDPWDTVIVPARRGPPRPAGGAGRLAKLDEAYRVAGEGDERAGRGPPRRGGGAVSAGLRARARVRRAALLGRARRRAGRATWTPRSPHMRAAIDDPRPAGWSSCGGLTPEVAPSAPAVLAALDGHAA